MPSFEEMLGNFQKAASIPEAKADDTDFNLQRAGLFGPNLEKAKAIVNDASLGVTPKPQEFKQAAKVALKYAKNITDSPTFQSGTDLEKQAEAHQKMQSSAKSGEEMSNKELLARILIGFAPTVIGAAVGGITGVGVGAGGAAGASAGLKGLESLDIAKREAEEKQRLAEKNKLEWDKFKLTTQKETAEEKRKERETAVKEKELGLKAQEIAQKAKEEKTLPQNQYAAAGFARRMQQSEDVFDALGQAGFDPTSPSASLQKVLPDIAQPDLLKRQIQAEQNWVNANLRRESGAAISQAEFDNAAKQYFPRPGDSPEVLDQKRLNRLQVQQNISAEAGKALQRVPYIAGSSESQFFGMPEAVAAPKKPKQIKQNGHTYILNEATGRYE